MVYFAQWSIGILELTTL